jgi:hypothetical protein
MAVDWDTVDAELDQWQALAEAKDELLRHTEDEATRDRLERERNDAAAAYQVLLSRALRMAELS